MELLKDQKEFRRFIENNPEDFIVILKKPTHQSKIHVNRCISLNTKWMHLETTPNIKSPYRGYLKSDSHIIKKTYPYAELCKRCKPNIKQL